MASFTDAWLPGPKSTSFYTRTYHPPSGSPRAVVVFIHGFAEHVARYEYVHKRWADLGFSVFTFDQRGFGRTALDSKKSPNAVYGRTGDADQISDITWALSVAQEANPTVPLFLMGHSMVRCVQPTSHFDFRLCLQITRLVWSRAVHWYCRSRRVRIRRRASRSCRALLRRAPVFASPSLRRVSHAFSVASHALSYQTKTYQRRLIARYVASSPDLFLGNIH